MDELQAILEEMRVVTLHVPKHQRALRRRLLDLHANPLPVRRRYFSLAHARFVSLRMVLAPRKVLSVATVIVVIALLVLGAMFIMPASHRTGTKRQLATNTNDQAGASPANSGPLQQETTEVTADTNRQQGDTRAAVSQGGASSSLEYVPAGSVTTSSTSSAAPPAVQNQPAPTDPVALPLPPIQVALSLPPPFADGTAPGNSGNTPAARKGNGPAAVLRSLLQP